MQNINKIPYSGWFHYPIIEGVMERINGFPIYALGGSIFTISSHLRKELPFSELLPHLMSAIPNLELVAAESVVDLPLSLPIIQRMLERFRAMTSPEEIKRRASDTLTLEELTQINAFTIQLSMVLFAELPQADIYYISQKRAYKMSLLLKNAEAVLAPEDISYLSDTTRIDIQEAGRCLAYDQHTAAGFHNLRAVEAVARKYYELVTATYATEDKKSEGRPLALYKLLDGLRTVYDAMGSPLDHPLGFIIGDLDKIRIVYRNPIMHPEMTLTASQSERVFNLSTGVITIMVEDVRTGGSHFKADFSWV